MNNNDLISRAAAIAWFFRPYSNEEYYSNLDVERALKAIPAVDAVPVEWLRNIILTCDDEESKAAYMLLHKWNDERFDNDGKIAIEK